MEGNQSKEKKNVMEEESGDVGGGLNILVNDYANLCSMKALERQSIHQGDWMVKERNAGLVSVLPPLFDQ